MSQESSVHIVDEQSLLLIDEQLSLVDDEQNKSTGKHYGAVPTHSADDESQLHQPNVPIKAQSFDFNAQLTTNVILLIGAFLVNLDSVVILSVFREIASEFNHLSSASWFVNGYIIGIIVSQALYGKLSDIYGRKPLLIFAYLCCIIGGVVAGIGFAFWGILVGRVISGIGSAGIAVLISTLIVDVVPIHEVAVWRGFVYALNQIGRAAGLPVGGFMTDGADWRGAILFQVPLYLLSLIFIWRKVNFPSRQQEEFATDDCSHKLKFKRIDFAGAASLGIANCSLLLFLDYAPRDLSIQRNLPALITLITWAGFLVIFLVVEAFFAREPILPLRLLIQRNVCSSYAVQFLQTVAQMALFTSVPLYFHITQGDTSSVTAWRLLYITAGTMVGGLVSGFVIKRTNLYRIVIWPSQLVSIAGLLAIFLRWRGNTGWLESSYGSLVGFGFGVSLSAAFIGLTASVEHSKVAVSTSGFYLSLNLGSLSGVGVASLLIQSHVRKTLLEHLKDIPNRESVVHEITSSFDKIDDLTGELKKVLVAAYTRSLVHVWLFALVCGCMAFGATFIMREGALSDQKGKAAERPSSSLMGRAKKWFLG